MDNNFKVFYIPKKNGFRKIVTYGKNNIKLRETHKNINILLYRRVLVSKFAKAYTKNRSIIKNAKTHMYNDIFIMFDIKDFFQSINHNWLIDKLYYEINLNHKKKVSKKNCEKIVKSCSISNKGLAVGFIPSPFLANIYMKDFDNILYGNLKQLELKNILYTRYADDIVISYKSNKTEKFLEIKSLIDKNLSKFGLKINNEKTTIINLNKSNHVRITGINVIKDTFNNRSISVGRKRKDDFYNLALKIAKEKKEEVNIYERKKIIGLYHFIVSVEGKGFEKCYSEKMNHAINNLGYKNFEELIKNI
ncbi:RNA-directed DNA polymerase [Clostridium perfringens]|nr:RNA-directed DNA polymerase [Clostridium perfringens]